MSTDRDTTRVVRSWLDDGVTALPDRVLDAVLEQVSVTPQRRGAAGRIARMNIILRVGLVAAAVVVVALVSYRLGSGSNFGAPGPSVSLSVAASETPVATATPAPGTVLPPNGFLSGKQALKVDGVQLSFEVQPPADDIRDGSGRAEWETFGSTYMTKNILGPQDAEAVVLWTSFPSNPYSAPCDYLLSQPAGVTAGDIAAAASTAPGIDLVAGPSEVMVGGRAAVRVELTVREDLGCDPGYFYTYPIVHGGAFWAATQEGDTITLWIIDVEGKRIVIEAETAAIAEGFQYPDGAPTLEQEIQAIIDSVQFE